MDRLGSAMVNEVKNYRGPGTKKIGDRGQNGNVDRAKAKESMKAESGNDIIVFLFSSIRIITYLSSCIINYGSFKWHFVECQPLVWHISNQGMLKPS